ncbi:hypothetical protein [Actinomyces sp.]|uniref:hypothetical protein n=1 Tax=Actinomyces sp. TaxID=29317 RepID=UPI0026DC99E7|nr:hypothetical protein [Actinomyces sp.]MDO4900853.1 hypothetical protein [Actinomyces sp.]
MALIVAPALLLIFVLGVIGVYSFSERVIRVCGALIGLVLTVVVVAVLWQSIAGLIRDRGQIPPIKLLTITILIVCVVCCLGVMVAGLTFRPKGDWLKQAIAWRQFGTIALFVTLAVLMLMAMVLIILPLFQATADSIATPTATPTIIRQEASS